MEHNAFEEPVRVFAGLGIPREIKSVFQAYTFLSEMPGHRNDPAHSMARKACLAAMDHRVEAETVRSAFERFARRAGILAPDVGDVIAASALTGTRSRTRA
ncbi:DUF982 domain-containing protein [Aureimonas mangrovi]|uniref:DUF982 domain-containing protein n=1 Tax=Aureimonas mangrovi TaxID=2758041 RepID=UPI00163DDD83|nr:DUF982 domain-containing protein [Aureimonas mangrovi]